MGKFGYAFYQSMTYIMYISIVRGPHKSLISDMEKHLKFSTQRCLKSFLRAKQNKMPFLLARAVRQVLLQQRSGGRIVP